MHRQATTYARLAESPGIKNNLSTSDTEVKIDNELQLTVIPISAEDTGLSPNRGGDDHFPFMFSSCFSFTWLTSDNIFSWLPVVFFWLPIANDEYW